MISHHTHTTKPISSKSQDRRWRLIDAKNQIIGKIATKASTLLQGKHKATYVDYIDSGDNVVIINAKDVAYTGQKSLQKVYLNYSGYPGGLRATSLERMVSSKPDQVVRRAISGMLPKNKHRKRRLARLYVYKDSYNPHESKISNLK